MITIRIASPAYESACNALLAACKLPTLDDGAQFGPQYVLASDERIAELTAMAGVEVHGTDGLLRSVAVAAHRRGDGLGARVVRDRVAWARAKGLGKLYLLTTDAAAYFRRFGFEVVTRDDAPPAIAASHLWSTVCPANATAMRLVL